MTTTYTTRSPRISFEAKIDRLQGAYDDMKKQRDELLAALRDCKAAIHHFLKADDQATQDHILDLASACATARAAIQKAESNE